MAFSMATVNIADKLSTGEIISNKTGTLVLC